MTYADQTGHTAHRNKLSRHWTKEVELDRKPQDSGSEKASCSEQQCYRLFDTQRLDDCIDWIHCGSPESYRTVRKRQSADRMDGCLQSQTADRVESQATNRVTTVRSCLNAIQRIRTMDSRTAASALLSPRLPRIWRLALACQMCAGATVRTAGYGSFIFNDEANTFSIWACTCSR